MTEQDAEGAAEGVTTVVLDDLGQAFKRLYHEFLETVVEHQSAELVTIKGQMALFTELLDLELGEGLKEMWKP